jgi:hypothetical protein
MSFSSCFPSAKIVVRGPVGPAETRAASAKIERYRRVGNIIFLGNEPNQSPSVK